MCAFTRVHVHHLPSVWSIALRVHCVFTDTLVRDVARSVINEPTGLPYGSLPSSGRVNDAHRAQEDACLYVHSGVDDWSIIIALHMASDMSSGSSLAVEKYYMALHSINKQSAATSAFAFTEVAQEPTAWIRT